MTGGLLGRIREDDMNDVILTSTMLGLVLWAAGLSLKRAYAVIPRRGAGRARID